MPGEGAVPVTAEDLRERVAGALRAAYNAHGTADRLPQMVSFGTLADAVLAALAGDPGDLPARMRKAAREAFADRVDAEGSLSISTHRNPWTALDDALAAAMSIRWEHAARQAAEVERLRAELAEAKAERDAKLRTKALGRSLVEMEAFAQRETARAAKAEAHVVALREEVAHARSQRDALTTELGHVQGTLSDARGEVEELTRENREQREEIRRLAQATTEETNDD